MAAISITRLATPVPGTLTLTNSVSTTGKFAMGNKAGGMLHCVSTATNAAVTVQFHNSPEPATTDTYLLCDSADAAISITMSPGRCYALPDALFAGGIVRPVLTSNTTAVCYIATKT